MNYHVTKPIAQKVVACVLLAACLFLGLQNYRSSDIEKGKTHLQDEPRAGIEASIAAANHALYIEGKGLDDATLRPNELVEAIGEASLRHYLSSPTNANTAMLVANALAMYAKEAQSGEVLMAYIKDPSSPLQNS